MPRGRRAPPGRTGRARAGGHRARGRASTAPRCGTIPRVTRRFDHDVLIVGSGFGGSVSALRLVEKGYDVCVLERGPRWSAKDFPRTNWDLRRSIWAPSLGCFGILRLSFLSDVFVLSGAGVGGGSLVYANTLYVPPDAFFEAEAWRGMRDWKSALMPHYRVAQFMLGVTQSAFEGEPDRVLRDVAKDLGREDTYVTTPVGVFLGAPNETVPDPYFGGAGPDRAGCNHCGGCMVGCRFNAKNTLDRNYLYLAEKLGAQVRPMRTVVDVRALPDGGYTVTHERTGAWFARDRQVTTAERVVLSAGVLGTVKILLDAKRRGSLPNVSSAVGRLVRTHRGRPRRHGPRPWLRRGARHSRHPSGHHSRHLSGHPWGHHSRHPSGHRWTRRARRRPSRAGCSSFRARGDDRWTPPRRCPSGSRRRAPSRPMGGCAPPRRAARRSSSRRRRG